jgi:RNA polymerase sigma-70 factor (sigma-E family)
VTFEEFVHSRGPALVRFARLLTNDDHRADDLVQDVLAQVLVKWRRVSAANQPDVYVRRMIVNANASWWRRRGNRELSVAAPAERAARHDTADIAHDIAERDHHWELIAKLPVRQRTVLVLRYYEDLDDATIAEILDISPVTVRTTAMRALHTLRERYTHRLTPMPGSNR